MGSYKKYIGVIIFVVVLVASLVIAYQQIMPKIDESKTLEATIANKEREYKKVQDELKIIQEKLSKLKDETTEAQKKIYAPVESDLGDDSLFFTLYNDMLEMIKSNFIKIKSIKYAYNPSKDPFVTLGGNNYFVCDINFELVSNYTNLGKLIEAIYQYPYYIKINKVDVRPYYKDKKILLTKLSLRMYARTEPEEPIEDINISTDTSN